MSAPQLKYCTLNTWVEITDKSGPITSGFVWILDTSATYSFTYRDGTAPEGWTPPTTDPGIRLPQPGYAINADPDYPIRVYIMARRQGKEGDVPHYTNPGVVRLDVPGTRTWP